MFAGGKINSQARHILRILIFLETYWSAAQFRVRKSRLCVIGVSGSSANWIFEWPEMRFCGVMADFVQDACKKITLRELDNSAKIQ